MSVVGSVATNERKLRILGCLHSSDHLGSRARICSDHLGSRARICSDHLGSRARICSDHLSFLGGLSGGQSPPFIFICPSDQSQQAQLFSEISCISGKCPYLCSTTQFFISYAGISTYSKIDQPDCCAMCTFPVSCNPLNNLYMSNQNYIYAKNLPIGSIVDLYTKTWKVLGVVTLYDGTFSFERVLLQSCTRKKYYNLVLPYEEMYPIGPDTYSTLPF